jgi:hypothetical protein
VVPPPPSETRISWTGLTPDEPVPAAEAPAAVAGADASTEIDASVKADAATTTEVEEATEPTPDASNQKQKKVVWSSAPSSYGDSGYGSRRDDY